MRIAVIGAGSAGHMAVAQVSHYLPDASITHFYDPSIPSIGVGEGTTPVLTEWAERVLGWDFDYLVEHCDATPKAGIVFEGWGDGETYTHLFGTDEGRACHLSASLLADKLAARSRATVVSDRVTSIVGGASTADVATETTSSTFDFVLDARGLPSELGEDHVALDCVPTSAALLVRGEPRPPRDRTRAVARPHGWIFVIPLGRDTAYGYVHSEEEMDLARADLHAFLTKEEVRTTTDVRSLTFPNFRRRQLCDGVVFSIGNQAGFVEPIEATSLGLVVLQLHHATFLLLQRQLDMTPAPDEVNLALAATMDEVATFIGWHYAGGSPFDTPFWQRAQDAFETWRAKLSAEQADRFNVFVERGGALPPALATAASIEAVDALVESLEQHGETYGGFLDISFTKVGHGINWY